VTLTDRDRKIALALLPLLLIVGCWFLLIAPKRKEAASASEDLAKQQTRLTTAQATVDQAASAKNTFASDYTEVVRLGKAIPPSVDMPGLLVQLDRAANGTGIKFTKIAPGEQTDTATPPQSTAGNQNGGSSSQPPVAAGGAQAQSGPGTAAEKANNASATSDQANQAAGASGVSPSDTQTSTTAGASSGTGTATSPAGLKAVPLTMEFTGNFFNLADFFHRVKRLVRTANKNVVVSGRLMTIEGVHYTSDPETFPQLKAEISATVYLVPAAEGTTAGATPSGPSATPTTPASTDQQPASTPPAATVTPR
jgi:Tfp pilus assembly protein PilO